MPNSISIDLVSDVVGTYDQTKTTVRGRAYKQLVDTTGKYAVGGPLSRFIDVMTDVGVAPVGPMWMSPNNRLYVLISAASTAATIAMYEFNPSTGLSSYVGKIVFVLPNSAATAHTVRGIRVYNDASNSASDWRVFVVTAGAVLPNGGTFCLNKVGRADFTPVGGTLAFATGTDQRGVYHMQNPAMMGALNTDTACAAIMYESSSGKLYVHHGIAATHQYIVYDCSVASLVYTNQSVSGITIAIPGVVSCAGHGYVLGDMIVFTGGTLPTGLTIGTNYFIKNPTSGTFEVALTSGGASITTTAGSATDVTVGRAFGQTGSGWLCRTGQLPALTGTMLLTDSENNAVPVNVPLNGAILNGNPCIAITTTTAIYLGLTSDIMAAAGKNASISVAAPGIVTCLSHGFAANDPVTFSVGTVPTGLALNTTYYVKNTTTDTFELSLTSGGVSITTTGAAGKAIVAKAPVTWPSLTTANLLGQTNEIVAPTATYGTWDNLTDGFVIITNTSKFLSKTLVNSQLRSKFGSLNTDYYEGFVDPRIQWGLAAISGIERRNGWLFACSATIGQRGIICMDMSADNFYGTSFITTPVLSLPGVTLRGYSHYWQLYDFVGDTLIYYRTTGFGSVDGNWQGPLDKSNINDVHVTSQVQFKIVFGIQSMNYATGPLITALNILMDSVYDISHNWEYSHDNSSSATPTRVAFRLKGAYNSSVPKLHFRAYDTEDSLLTHFNTTDNPTYFEYSTDGGTVWNPLGTIPNTVGTLLRFTFVSPPGVPVRVGLLET